MQLTRPRKLLYMAVDGVAPRAKMNQQRSRRFRAARDLEEAKVAAKLKGEEIDDAEIFDSNCITPGTDFMARVSTHLKYFIRRKMKDDPLWSRITVIFSGHEVRRMTAMGTRRARCLDATPLAWNAGARGRRAQNCAVHSNSKDAAWV